MTQALINSLNIISEKTVGLADKMSKNEGMDFGKIFETKTGDFSKKINDINHCSQKTNVQKQSNQKNDTQPDWQNAITNSNKDIKSKNNTELKSETKDTNQTSNEISTDADDTNTTLHGMVREFLKDNEQSTETAEQDTENTIVLTEETILDITTEETAEAEDTTITEEDPTMYRELITLENPTALFMLQSQVPQNLTIAISNEQADVTTEDSLNTLTSQNSNAKNADTAVFKQFETAMAKDATIVNNVPKQHVQPKTENQGTTNVINENMLKELNAEVISSQSAEMEASAGDLMQNQSPQEQTARVMIQGDIKYESVQAEASKNISQVKTQTISPSKIIDQITKQMETQFNNSKLNMVLNPGSLGKLNLQIVNSKSGLTAQFTVTTQEARDILMKGLDGLKESLLAQGINVENVSVKLEETESEYKQDYTEQEGSKGGNKHQGAKKQKNDGKDFEQMMFNLENEGNV